MMDNSRKISADILQVIAQEIKTNKIDDVRIKRNVQKPSLVSNLSQYFSEYCRSSGVHGIRYVGERKLFVIERFVWLATLTVLCYFCISLILKSYNKWVTSPVIVNFATRETPIWLIPFPAITICPESKFDVTLFNYTDVYLKKLHHKKTTADEDQYLESLSLLCHNGIDIEMDLLLDYNFSKTVNDSALYDLGELFPWDSFNLTDVYWLGRPVDSSDMLMIIYTSEGLCVVFNMLHPEEFLHQPNDFVKRSTNDSKSRFWNLEEGYPNGSEMDTFPKRSFIPGVDGGLNAFLFTNHSHVDYLCGSSLQGFKVALHHPTELPNMDQFFRVPLDQSVLVAIKPRMITVTKELESYTPEKRTCFFAHERHLKFYKSYTQKNCFDECFTNFTLIKCHCRPFYMPAGNDSSIICGAGSKICLQKAKMKYLAKQTEYCNCLPTCTSLSYDVEISQTNLPWRESYETYAALGRTLAPYDVLAREKDHLSNLIVYYREMQFLSSERHELYGMVDFFSNTGGLLGLFMGFSVTSAIEIAYFLTLRLFCNIRRYGKTWWAGQQDN